MPSDGEATASERKRLPALDGLRGLAALVVLLHHTLLASQPTLAGPYNVGPYPTSGSLAWLITFTPLHIFWAGGEFVVLFFVLSGFVLSLPTARSGKQPRIASYYPSRFLRLYLPVWAALLFAAALHFLGSHASLRGASWWLNGHSQALTLEGLRQDAGLLSKQTGLSWALPDVLWSLRWEVLFSLALPLLLMLAVRVRSWHAYGVALPVRAHGRPPGAWHSWSTILALLCLLALARHGSNEYLLELPPFLLGMLLAFRFAQIQRLALALRARTPRNTCAQLLLGAVCICALTADWWIPGEGAAITGLGAVLVALGACLMLIAALSVRAFGAFLCSSVMAWTGKRSYSLYLVHSPIVVALAFAYRGHMSPGYLLGAISLSLLAAALFFHFFEAPAHRLARRLGSAAPAGGTLAVTSGTLAGAPGILSAGANGVGNSIGSTPAGAGTSILSA
jgi:peptidoglycan/LPS O-acetylase OafA/YrhL